MKKTRRTTMLLALVAVLALAAAILVACKDMPAKITFDGNGATGGTAPQAIDTTIGATVTLPECELTKTGHTFDGWKTGDKTYKAGDTFEVTAAETTFTAQWKAEQGEPDPTTYALTYAAGEHGTGTAPAAVQKEAGAKFNLAAATTFTAETGYEFDGWSDGTKTYAAGAEFTMPAKAVTLTAIWKKVPVLEEFFGECVLSAVNTSDQSPIPSVPSVTVVGLKIDFANKKAYYKLTDSADWVDGKYFADSSTSKHKPDNYGSDALYIDIKIETIAYYALIKQDMTMLYLCNSDDATLENGEFENVNTERTVTYIKPEGVTGTTPEAQTVQRGTKVTLASADTFAKEGWTFYKWQVSSLETLRAPATQFEVTTNVNITPVFQKVFICGGDDLYEWGKITVRDDGIVIISSTELEYDIEGNIATIPEYFGMSIELDEENGKYYYLDSMINCKLTANDGTTKLTFDGKGGAMLGTTAGTYEFADDGATLKLTIGGQTYSMPFDGMQENFGIKIRITIDGTTYVFGEEATVTYELGTDVTGTAPAAQTVFKGEQVTLPDGTGLTNGDKTFIGWTVKGGAETVLTGKYTVNGDVTLVSAWKDSAGGGGDEPSGGRTKLSEYIGQAAASAVNYGFSSLTDAGDNKLTITTSLATQEHYRIQLYKTATAISGNRYHNDGKDKSAGITLYSSQSTSDKVSDADISVIGQTFYISASGVWCSIEFGENENHLRTIKITNLTTNISVTWTEITA